MKKQQINDVYYLIVLSNFCSLCIQKMLGKGSRGRARQYYIICLALPFNLFPNWMMVEGYKSKKKPNNDRSSDVRHLNLPRRQRTRRRRSGAWPPKIIRIMD